MVAPAPPCSGSHHRRRTNAPLRTTRCTNTLGAANYTEVVKETTPQGKQTDYLVYQAPDRLGGYVQSGNKRTYVYVIGN